MRARHKVVCYLFLVFLLYSPMFGWLFFFFVRVFPPLFICLLGASCRFFSTSIHLFGLFACRVCVCASVFVWMDDYFHLSAMVFDVAVVGEFFIFCPICANMRNLLKFIVANMVGRLVGWMVGWLDGLSVGCSLVRSDNPINKYTKEHRDKCR